MGNEVSGPRQMEKTLFNMKFTSRQLVTESKKFEARSKAETRKLVAAMKTNDAEMIKIYAANVIRDKKQSVNFMRLSSRIDAVSARVETAIRMNTLSKQIGQVVRGMDAVLAGMDAEKITGMMDQFEKQFDNLDVRSGVMESAIESSTASAIPEEDVASLINMVAAKNKDELGDKFDAASIGIGPVASAVVAPATRTAEAVSAKPAGGEVPPAPPSGGPPPPSGGAGDSGGDSTSALQARFNTLRQPPK